MKKTRLLILILITLGMMGCGEKPNTSLPQYVGSWSGSWMTVSNGTGSIAFNIDSLGTISGQISNSQQSLPTTLTGRFYPADLSFTLNYQFLGSAAVSIFGTFGKITDNQFEGIYLSNIAGDSFQGWLNVTKIE